MARSLIHWAFASLVMATVVSGCVSPRSFDEGPDLIPLKPPGFYGPESLCNLSGESESPKLGVSVQNIGEGESPASMTTIEFFPGGSFLLQTPALPGGESVDLMPVAIPLECFDPDCDFRITVDPRNEVNESGGEGNNVADGRCLRF